MRRHADPRGLWDAVTSSFILPTAFASGVAIALAHLAISLELCVSLTYHETFTRSIFLALYPLGVSFMGGGAVLERRLNARYPPLLLASVSLRAAGAAILGFLVLTLRFNFFVAGPAALVASGLLHFAALAAWFLSLGVAVAGLLRGAKRREDSRWVGWAWALHLTGLVVGYATADLLVHSVGANGILLAVGVSLLAASRGAPLVLGLILAVAPGLSLDRRIEDLRDIGTLLRGEVRSLPAAPHQTWGRFIVSMHRGAQEILFRGWSRFGHVQITRTEDREIRGFYNFVPQWAVREPGDPDVPIALRWRSALYSVLRPEHRVLLLAAGGGRGVSCLPFPPHAGVTTVELNEAVVGFLRDERPDLNGGYLGRTTALSADVRFVIDTAREPFDAILVETGRFHPAQVMEPAGSPQTLYTRESVGRYLSRLKPGGLLLMVFDNTTANPRFEYLPLQVMEALAESGIPSRILSAVWQMDRYVAIAASHDPALLESLEKRTSTLESVGLRRIPWRPRSEGNPCHSTRLTDDRPFSQWNCMEALPKRLLLGTAGLFALAPLLLLLWACRRSWRAPPASPFPFFFLIGAAQVMMQIGVIYAYRVFFGDAVTTAVRLTIYFLAFGGVGCLAAHRLLGASRRTLWTSGGLLLSLHAAGLAFIPFTAGPWLREVFAVLTLAPGCLFMGALFPAAILAVPEEDLDRSLLADCLGAVAGFACFYLILLPFGIGAFLGAAFALYAAVLGAFPATGLRTATGR